MKKIFLLLFLSFFCFEDTVFAQTPSWHWAQAGVGNNSSFETRGIGTDAAGDVYAAIFGISSGGVTFGNINLPSEYMYVVKYNKHGQVKWAKAFSNCKPYALSADAAGNSYITGDFWNTTSIGSTTLTCNGKKDIFVAKFDSAGNALWAKRAGGPGYPAAPPPVLMEDGGTSIAVDTAGNCYVGGVFEITNYPTGTYNYVTFDTITYSLPASISAKAFGFLAKYNASGQIQWMRRIEAKKSEQAVMDMAISKQGNIFVIGSLYDTLKFNNLPPLISNGSDDVYYARFDSNGNPVWAKSFGGTAVEVSNAIAVDAQEQCHLTGYFYSSNLPIGNNNLTGSSQRATTFVAKTDGNGNILWASQNTGLGSMGDTDIALDSAGNAYVSASFTGSINIGQQALIASSSIGSPLVSKWSSTGIPQWAVTAQGEGVTNKLTIDKNTGECYISGSFEGSVGFGSYSVSVLAPASGVFFAKLSSNATGITEAFRNELLVYPNPAQNVLYLNIPEAKENVQLHLTDVQGKTVLSRKLEAGNAIKLELPDLAKGLYILQAQTGKQIFRKKMVID